ncbi:MAG TPA: sigma-70 family RNA polymerase sigma factor [Rhizomicrobium sp.]|jgi:RNA polymerase sigma-70 factor (ECF subfamily)
MTDGELAALAASGDEAAYGLLVRRHQSRLRGFLRRLTRGDAALADDLAQESLFEAWRKLAQFTGKGSFVGWLLAIAWSRYLMTARKRKLEPLEDADGVPFETGDPDAKLDLEKAMARLSLPERGALTLCLALEFSHEEAAEMMALPLGTVKSHIARGRGKLRRLLGLAS